MRITERRIHRCAGCVALIVCSVAGSAVRAQQAPVPRRIPDGFTLAAGGDLLGPSRPITQLNAPGFVPIQKLLQGADVAFANFEGILTDSTFRGAQSPDVGSASLRTLAVAKDYAAMGIDIVSVANNHAGDLGVAGFVHSIKLLNELGLRPAGGGNSLAEARGASFYASPKGRVALVATTSTYQKAMPAGAPSQRFPARPGVSALRNVEATLVSDAEFEVLRTIQARESGVFTPAPAPGSKDVLIGTTPFTSLFRASDRRGKGYDLTATDVTELVQAVTDAERTADFTIFSIHAHETGSGNSEDRTPPDFAPQLFHQLIDAGADAVIRHGPHATMGIEIYKGRPIFYSLGSLFFAVGRPSSGRGSVPPAGATGGRGGGPGYPPDWYESFVPVAEYRGGQLSELRLYPVVMELDNADLRSTPLAATGEDAIRILERVKRESAPFGTQVSIMNGVGVIRGPASR